MKRDAHMTFGPSGLPQPQGPQHEIFKSCEDSKSDLVNQLEDWDDQDKSATDR